MDRPGDSLVSRGIRVLRGCVDSVARATVVHSRIQVQHSRSTIIGISRQPQVRTSRAKKKCPSQNVSDCFHILNAKISRDSVYGLLDLVKESERPEIDYDFFLHEVFLDVLKVASLAYWQTGSISSFYLVTETIAHVGLEKHQYAIAAIVGDIEDICDQARE
jgi:hypothetical protein